VPIINFTHAHHCRRFIVVILILTVLIDRKRIRKLQCLRHWIHGHVKRSFH